jgi:hypothetical protein
VRLYRGCGYPHDFGRVCIGQVINHGKDNGISLPCRQIRYQSNDIKIRAGILRNRPTVSPFKNTLHSFKLSLKRHFFAAAPEPGLTKLLSRQAVHQNVRGIILTPIVKQDEHYFCGDILADLRASSPSNGSLAELRIPLPKEFLEALLYPRCPAHRPKLFAANKN